MKHQFLVHILIVLASLLTLSCGTSQKFPLVTKIQTTSATATLDPAELYGQLFEQVQLTPVFDDSKYFVDMTPKYSPETIVSAFRLKNPKSKAELRAFVDQSFSAPVEPKIEFTATAHESIDAHIKKLWTYLKREPEEENNPATSLIALPFSYVVPGGRFREIYYWDSYFTQLGLLADNEDELFKNMVKNFEHLLLTTGRIPNGNRDYYRGRSQPPFFSHMVALWKNRFGPDSAAQFLPALEQEHKFWMTGSENLKNGDAAARVVMMSDGSVLNRYWDDKAAPRPEAFKEDFALAKTAASQLKRKPDEIYRDLRAGAESGWDYSTRWFKNPKVFASIQTTSIAPIDLNSLLYHLEKTIADLYRFKNDHKTTDLYQGMAERRRNSILKFMWNEKSGTFQDYNWKTQKQTGEQTLAMVVPLFVGLATTEQASRVEKKIEHDFLKAGGLVTTLRTSHQQWDAPNGWAPHQWMAYAGLKRYGPSLVANKLSERWLQLNRRVFETTGKLMEKYNVVDISLKSGGGEYPTQDGFGWTNGVYRALSTPLESMKHLIQ